MRSKTLLTLFCLSAPIAISAQTGGVSRADRVLNANKAATTTSACPRQGTLRQHFASAAMGMDASVTSIVDIEKGLYVEQQDVGPMHLIDGFDGRVAWQQDLSGALRTQGGGEKRLQAISQAYRNAGRWWNADRGGAAIVDRGTSEADGRRFDVLEATPPGGQPFTAWFDATTHLLDRVLQRNGTEVATTFFSDYRAIEGCKIVGKIVVDDGNGEQYRQTSTLIDAHLEPALPNAAYAMPRRSNTDISFPEGSSRTTVPFRLQNNHIVTDVRINGQGPFNVILDTGGMAMLTPDTAKALTVASHGNAAVTGVGTEVDSGGFAHNITFQIGGVTLRGQNPLVADMEAPQPAPTALQGMLGYELFRRLIVQVNYRDQTLTLIDPAKFDHVDAGTAVPFEFAEQMPEVEGSFDGISGRFRIDTGARSELTLTSPFAAGHNVRGRHPHGVEAISGSGVGGVSRSYVTRASGLRLGALHVDDIVTELSTQKKGAFADPSYAGNIGGGLLKRFMVTFDYGHQTIYLKPRTDAVPDTGTYDRAGIWLQATHDGIKVVDVVKDGPAAQAGLQAGDIIRTVDGVGTSEVIALRYRFRNDPVGTQVTLTYSRTGDEHIAKLLLRDQI
jgi:hypothetical protein